VYPFFEKTRIAGGSEKSGQRDGGRLKPRLNAAAAKSAVADWVHMGIPSLGNLTAYETRMIPFTTMVEET
jgi:hypothetical protein